MRAATYAGPISAPAAIAWTLVAPAASRMRGKCAAIAPVTLQAAADALQSESRQRPADRGSKTRDQGDAGDGAARRVAVDAAERAEGGVIKAKSHADAEQQPGCGQHRDRMRETEQGEPRGKRQIGDRQHLASADAIDLPADARAEQGRNHQRRRKRRKDPVRGNAEIVRDRIGQDGRQIIAGGPCQRLRRTQRQNDWKLALAHCIPIIHRQ
jgi:hypothetical protein